MEPIIKIENLSKIYGLGRSNETPALQDVNLEIYPGEYVVFFGPSGCGKSTLLYCVAGLETPTRGEVYIWKEPLSRFSPEDMVSFRRLQIGMIFQAYNLIPTLNVLDNVMLPTILGGTTPGTNPKRAELLLERFGIAKQAYHYPGELSGGQQQRVAIARALIYWPPILFADEPVGNLDSKSAQVVMELLTELNKKDGKTVVLVTHNPFYLSYAHRVFHMKDGRVLRETVNPERTPIAPKKQFEISSSKIETLARLYPHLSEAQLKAKALAQSLITSLDERAIKRLEHFIEQRIKGQITRSELKQSLDKPLEQGGAGLYRQTAEEFTQKVEDVLTESAFLQQKIIPPKRPLTEIDIKTKHLRRHLLDHSRVLLTKEQQIQRLEHFIRMRLEQRIDKKRFKKFLDLPFKQGGVGLNRRTARAFSKMLELALVKY